MARPGFDEVTLLTGLPGFLPRKVAAQILSTEPRTLVRALVPGPLQAEAKAFVDGLPADQGRRIEVLEGDVAAMDLGLPGTDFLALAREVDRIHHAAPVTRAGGGRAAAEAVNVGGAREVLELARAAPGLKALVHYSSVFVAGDRTGVVREDELEHGQRFADVIQETLARGEKVVRAAAARLPIVVVRPSMIVGDTATGEVDHFDGPYLLFMLILTAPPDFAVPLPSGCDLPLPIVPVDYVARAAWALGRDPRALGRTFHLVDPSPPTARAAFERVAQVAGHRPPRRTIPAPLAHVLLRSPMLERFAARPRVLMDALVRPVTFASDGAVELLTPAGIACPPFESYVGPLVAFAQGRVRRERSPKRAAPPSALDVDDPLV